MTSFFYERNLTNEQTKLTQEKKKRKKKEEKKHAHTHTKELVFQLLLIAG